MDEKVFVENLVIVLGTAALTALLFHRLRLALIPAYLVTGMLIGPSVLGLIGDSEALVAIGHLAVVLLLFGVGMELHFTALKRDARVLLGTSIGACLLSVLVFAPVVSLFGLTWPQAWAVAMGLSLSSTALVLRLVSDLRELTHRHGQLSLAILVTQDLAVLAMLAVLPWLAEWYVDLNGGLGGQEQKLGVAFDTVGVTLGIILLVLFARNLAPRLLHAASRTRSSEMLLLTGVAVALFSSFVTYRLGFSLEMGAFLTGFVLATSPIRYQLAGQVGPLRDLFMAIFFTVLGMEVAVGVVLEYVPYVIVGTILLLVIKAVVIAFAGWLFGVPTPMAVKVGLRLAQAGEFTLIIFSKASSLNLLDETEMSIGVAIVVLSLLATPGLFTLSSFFADRLAKFGPAPWYKHKAVQGNTFEIQESLNEHVIIGGFGPVGRALQERLAASGIPHVVVELNSRTVSQESRPGLSIIFGDIGNEEVLRKAGVESAQSVILTFPAPEVAKRVAATVNRLAPGMFIAARASTFSERAEFSNCEVDHVFIDEEASGAAMAELVYRFEAATHHTEGLGVEEEAVGS